MKNSEKAEFWLRGPIPGIPALVQPVAHALLQALDELSLFQNNFPKSLLWEKPSGVASVGFHLRHIAGVLDRLFTYAREESLSESQLNYLRTEGIPDDPSETYQSLIDKVADQVQIALNQLKDVNEDSLTEIRYVGRAMVPSTHIGLLFHAAEHTQRHVGQLLVTAKVLMSKNVRDN